MQPAQTLQLLVPERLDTEAQTIDARVAEAASVSAVIVSGLASSVISASGVTANVLRQVAIIAATSSGSSRDGVPPPKKIVSAGSPSRPAVNLLLKRGDVLRLQIGVEETPIEVAVVTDGRTERDMDVEAQGHVGQCYDPALPPDHFRSVFSCLGVLICARTWPCERAGSLRRGWAFQSL